ncbi:hypothetical protein BD769DRAFT_8822 [Suillus cothurnatus]|nr:hypothetical protein BD769DRAFT_8822 [Suillus cothurnatus]
MVFCSHDHSLNLLQMFLLLFISTVRALIPPYPCLFYTVVLMCLALFPIIMEWLWSRLVRNCTSVFLSRLVIRAFPSHGPVPLSPVTDALCIVWHDTMSLPPPLVEFVAYV